MKSFRNMCSTPQKQPAAIVAFSAPSGTDIVVAPPDSGVSRRVLEVNGRVKRAKMEDMVGRVMIVNRKMRSLVSGFSLMVANRYVKADVK